MNAATGPSTGSILALAYVAMCLAFE